MNESWAEVAVIALGVSFGIQHAVLAIWLTKNAIEAFREMKAAKR